jgi:hypothetical protein
MWVLLKKARFGCSDTAAGESIMPTEVPEGLTCNATLQQLHPFCTDELNSWGVRCFAEKYRNIPRKLFPPLLYVSIAFGKHQSDLTAKNGVNQ